MANLLIAGISGAGKSYLEGILKQNYGYTPLIKYSNRPLRPGEKGLISMSDAEFDSMQHEFLAVITQTGFKYGYKKTDIEGMDNRTFAVPLKDIEAHIKATNTPMIPIVMIVDLDNLDLIQERMKVREDFYNLDETRQEAVLAKINERMKLAEQDIKVVEKYRDFIELKKGRIFTIKNNDTIFDEILPFIESLN